MKQPTRNTMKHRLLLGAHISIAGGLEKSIERGESIFCTTMQIFVKSNRQWVSKPLTEEEIKNFQHATHNSSVNPIVAHAGYLINLGSPDSSVVHKSLQSLKEELERCELLGVPYLVFHPGSIGNAEKKASLLTIATRINEVFDAVPGKTKLLLETMAGQGNCIGQSFEDLAFIMNTISTKKRVGICFDTCHVWAAGFDFSTPKKYTALWHQFDDIIGLNHLFAMHINDSKNDCGSQVDRHEDIGKGKLGIEAFRLIMNDEQLFTIPKILETPKKSLEDDLRNLKTLVDLITPATQRKLNIPQGWLK
jgi:deoxyribonuclease IV